MANIPNIVILVVGSMIVLQVLSFAVRRSIASADANDIKGTVFWAFAAGTPLIVLFTLLSESAIGVWGRDQVSLKKVGTLSIITMSLLGYLAFSIYNYVTASRSGNIQNAVNWSSMAIVPLVIVLTLWFLQMV